MIYVTYLVYISFSNCFSFTPTELKQYGLLSFSFHKSLTVRSQLQGVVEAQQHQAEILTECAKLMDAGKLKIKVTHTFPLEEAAKAHQMLETGSQMGKIFLLNDNKM